MSMLIIILAIIRFLFSIGLIFAVLFESAGRWDYWNGWVYFLLQVYVTLFSWLIIPLELLQERTTPGPGTKEWDFMFFAVYGILYFILTRIAALDGGQYHWTGNFPLWINALAFVVIFLGCTLFIFSLWKNRFFSAVVRIQKDRGHYVIDKGPYAVIRHPGYAGAIISFLSVAFAMNSLSALVPSGLLVIAIIIRTYLEDITLQKELPGYIEYVARVRYRLIPKIW